MNNFITRITLAFLSLVSATSALAQSGARQMSGTMHGEMMDSDPMGWPMMLLCVVLALLVIGLLVLAISAIAKYLRNRKSVD